MTHYQTNTIMLSTLKDAISGYHKLKLCEESSYLTTFAFQFSKYRYARIPFGAETVDDMFQRKVDEIVKEFPHASGIVYDILLLLCKAVWCGWLNLECI